MTEQQKNFLKDRAVAAGAERLVFAPLVERTGSRWATGLHQTTGDFVVVLDEALPMDVAWSFLDERLAAAA